MTHYIFNEAIMNGIQLIKHISYINKILDDKRIVFRYSKLYINKFSENFVTYIYLMIYEFFKIY